MIQKNKKHLIIFAIILIALGGCAKKRAQKAKFYKIKPITIFVHGTLPPLCDKLVHAIDCPLGLTPATKQGNKFVHGKIGYILNNEDCRQFPLESFYLFGWSGKLSFAERKNAAIKLYESLSKLHRPITLIGHSHGCNVILNLAEVAKEKNNKRLKIDRIILLAGPVQEVTSSYVKSDIFKKVYSLYSKSDIIQIADPQGIYQETKSKINEHERPFFSKRIFPYAPNIMQARILMGSSDPGHHEFIFGSFIRNLPDIISVLNKTSKEKGWDQKPVTINIPAHYKKAHIVKNHHS